MGLLFSIVIPTCHRNDMLALCLDRLSPHFQQFPSELYQILVSDDGRVTTSEELIKEQYPFARWIQGPQKGPASNRNNGAKNAKGEWLIFIDDDCLPDPLLLESYKKAIEANEHIQVLEGRIYVDRPKARHDEESPINETGGYLWSCNFAILKQVFDRLEGFDESFPFAAMEDVDLHYRLVKSGVKMKFLKDAAVLHPWRISSGMASEKKKIASTIHYLKKNPEEISRLSMAFYVRSFYHTVRNFVCDIRFFGLKGANVVFSKLYGILLSMYHVMKLKFVG